VAVHSRFAFFRDFPHAQRRGALSKTATSHAFGRLKKNDENFA